MKASSECSGAPAEMRADIKNTTNREVCTPFGRIFSGLVRSLVSGHHKGMPPVAAIIYEVVLEEHSYGVADSAGLTNQIV